MERILGIPKDRIHWVDLPTLFREADLVTFHCPSMPDNRPLLDRAALATLKPGAVIVKRHAPASSTRKP